MGNINFWIYQCVVDGIYTFFDFKRNYFHSQLAIKKTLQQNYERNEDSEVPKNE